MQIVKPLSRLIRPLSIAALTGAMSVTGLSVAHAATGSPSGSHPRTDAVTVPAHMLSPQQLKQFSHLLHQQHDTAGQTSNNWSGYAATGGTFSTITSSWVEPSVSCNSRGIVAFWIGLDGDNSPTVEQDGTGVDCSSGSPQQFAWWETFPANSIQEYPDPVRAGDSVTSTVTAQGGGRYNMVLTDNSEGWTETKVVSANGQNASAEIIAEAVTSGNSVTPLPNFGSVSFSGSTIDNQSLQNSGASSIDMINSAGSVIASTGPVNGGSFTVTFGAGNNPPPGNTVTVNSPGDQTNAVGDRANLQITGSDSGGAGLTFSATGLPTGASISRSGLITGTLNTAGTFNVTVTATDSTGASGKTSFNWTVGSNNPPPPPGCNGLAAWSATTSYIPGNQVSFDGDKWKAIWYSTNAVPNAPQSWNVWQDEGAC